MAFVLFAIGAVMSGAGVYAIVSGYSIIQVEEGWASVISGASLVSGGVLTAALGLVLQSLNHIRAALSNPNTDLVPDGTLPLAVPPMPVADPLQAVHPAQPAYVAPSFQPTKTAELTSPEASEAAPDDRRAAATLGATPPTAPTPADPAPAHPEPTTFAPIAFDEAPEPTGPTSPDPEPAARPADDYKLDAQPPPGLAEKPAELPATPELNESPAMDDWLDRAFAELDRDNPPLPPAKPDSVGQQRDLEPAEAAPAAYSPVGQAEPSAASAAHLEPAALDGPAQSPVIGRYESDGTSYVMYADGSIEAQSATGVYRFASMAELKAFIES